MPVLIKEYYTVKDLMALFECKIDAILDRLHRGEFGEILRFGREYRIPRNGVEMYIKNNTGKANGRRQYYTGGRKKSLPPPRPLRIDKEAPNETT